MNVTAQNHDDVSALLTVTLDKADYKEKVEKQLINYAKKAQIPGFRKGKVPLSLIRKQYEASVAYEEINNLVNDSLNNYITEKNLRLVGQPVPQPVDEFDFQADQLSVSFEVGYEEDFSINLADYEAPHYIVSSSEKEINQSIENMQKRFAEQLPQDAINEESNITIEITQVVEENAEGEHNHPMKRSVITKDNTAAFEFVKSLKSYESKKISKKDLQENMDLIKDFGMDKAEVDLMHHDELEVKVSDFHALKNHEINQELFDKVYGEGNINSEEELKNRIKTELDEYFQQNADVHFVNKILDNITSNQEVKLPETFLKKWLIFSNENINTEEQAEEIITKERDIIKTQIIEGKLMKENNVIVNYEDIVAQAETGIKNQLAMYGIHHIDDAEVQKYAIESLKNEEQVRLMSSEVAMAKLKDIILDKATKVVTEISHDDFLEELKK